ncbi:hypothetical protein FOL47_009355 [Perkinsus chesapeaki]|uniref:FLYWCH-type domain-containing protein n=1 Tax=Perkinsus chesapeaki TaxID=330153 RepID=A0A7J6L8Q2_PERCH|nr:hypothetical protein FOL47_009355 [Perkinsus chesapeaki]
MIVSLCSEYPTVDLTLVPLEQPYYVESFSGRRSLLAFHGYLYRQDSSYKNKQHWRCINYHKEMHCPSTLITTGDIDDASTLIVMNLKKIKYHICGRPNARSRVLYHEAAKLAMSVDDDEKGSLVQIYDEIIGGEPPEVLEQLPKKESVLEYMRKMRVKARMGGAATRVQPSGKPTAEIHEDI